jgi:probable phosphomutase (TIGR03848 family)
VLFYTAKMPTLLLVRHGRSTANSAGVLTGRAAGVHLDDTGLEQARAAGVRLDPVTPVVIVSSPLERCRETAAGMFPGRDVVVEDRLMETDFGDWTGRLLSDLVKEPLWAEVQSAPSRIAFPRGESFAALSGRVTAAIEEWDDRVRQEYGPWAIWAAVSHADPIKAVVAHAIGLGLDRFQSLVVNPSSISVLHRDAERTSLLSLNNLYGPLEPYIPTDPGASPAQGPAGAGSSDPAEGECP